MIRKPRKDFGVVFVLLKRYSSDIVELIKKEFINDDIYWFTRSREIAGTNVIVTHPFSIRKYAYMYISYLFVMFKPKFPVRVVSDNFSDLILINYAQGLDFFYLERKETGKVSMLEINDRCGLLPFDTEPFAYEKIAKEISSLRYL